MSLRARALLLLAFVLLYSLPATACPVCYGDLEPNVAKGFFWGIILLMLLPPALIFYIIYNVVSASKKQA